MYRVHVTAFVGGVAAFIGSIAVQTLALVAVAGVLFVAAGVTAFVGRRSAFVPRGVRPRIEAAEDPRERERLEAANGRLTGTLFVVFGAVVAGYALFFMLA
jgi:hypothetical protein